MSDRRQFLSAVASSTAALACNALLSTSRLGAGSLRVASDRAALGLGLDNFAVRAHGWKASELIDYAARLQVDALFITDLDAFESLAEKDLMATRDQASAQGIRLYVGTWSICPTSKTFRDKWGTAEEHLALGIRTAKALGSPVVRVVLGSREDRGTPGGIRARIADTVKVLKSQRSFALDSGVKVAVENHAGDMHSTELVDLVEAAGPDFVGVNLDSGNAVWTLEDPLANLENLGRYVLTSSLRDTAAWESERGVTAQWTAMGEGQVDWDKYFATFRELCPAAPVNIETISGFHHVLPVKSTEYWNHWPAGKPPGYERFLEFVERGVPRQPHPGFQGERRIEQEQEYQRSELERSLEYCKQMGLGRKTREAASR